LAGNRVQRRLTTILAADIAGYSRLMGADEEGTLARLNELRRASTPAAPSRWSPGAGGAEAGLPAPPKAAKW
jgi:hypothetical protein